jgi:hypothetical protein
MPIALVLLALACLIAATVLWQRNKKMGVDGAGTGATRVAIIVLVIAGILLALASQLPVFRG